MQIQTCYACSGTRVDPIQPECCNKIVCRKCYDIAKKRKQGVIICPFCQMAQPKLKNLEAIKQITCKNGCGLVVKAAEYDNHVYLQCPNIKVKCRWCQQKLNKQAYIHHVATTHPEDFNIFLVEQLPGKLQKIKKLQQTYNFKTVQLDMKPTYVNDRGFEAKRGTTGKIYCGQSLIIAGCGCDGYCGPNNGCSCLSCMKLQLQIMGASQFGCLINGNGRLCRIGFNGKPYCGLRMASNTENYCNWDQAICSDCRYLQTHKMSERYAQLLKNLPKVPLPAHYVGDLFE